MNSILALDVGEKRVGVAIANTIARLPSPLTTLDNNDTIYESIAELVRVSDVSVIVVGLPRNLSGEDTAQTAYCRQFAEKLPDGVEIVFQDEALTSQKAEAELKRTKKSYTKGDIDSLAATFILEDYLLGRGV